MRCSIVVIIDRSGSMKDYNYMEPAKTDASSFIASMHPGPTEGDSLGVVAFNQDSTVIFGSKASLAPLKSKPDQLAAIAQVKKLKGTGQTNMAGAIGTAGAMLKGATGNLAEVLLSDGQYNKGLNPRDVLVGAPPIYTISLGPSAGTATLEEIANVTGGQYHDSPDAYALGEMYNYIAGEAGVAALLTNNRLKAESFFPEKTPRATVPAGAAEAMFVINWTDPDIVFTPVTPAGKQVNVALYDPRKTRIQTPDTITGDGFVVFKIPNPQPGDYFANVWYSGPGTLPFTAAVFDDLTGLTAAIGGPRKGIAAGAPATLDFRLADGGDPIDDARVEVTLESPLVTLAEAGKVHAERLKAVSLPDDVPDGNQLGARIAALQNRTGENLLPRQLRAIAAQAVSGGLYRLQIPALEKAGSHTVRVVVHGHSARSKTAFQRSSAVSFVVPER